MAYEVELSKRAAKIVRSVDAVTRRRLQERMRQLGASPYDTRLSKPLVNMEGMRSSRVGGWRILYTVAEHEVTLYVVAVRPRGQAYR